MAHKWLTSSSGQTQGLAIKSITSAVFSEEDPDLEHLNGHSGSAGFQLIGAPTCAALSFSAQPKPVVERL